MQSTSIAMPNSTCQNRILNGNGIARSKLILTTNRVLRMAVVENTKSNSMFHIFL